jgi:nucleoside-diphosphate-sugar epimerase
MKTVLITGAAGNIGSQLRREFAGRYQLRLSDKRLIGATAGETNTRRCWPTRKKPT